MTVVPTRICITAVSDGAGAETGLRGEVFLTTSVWPDARRMSAITSARSVGGMLSSSADGTTWSPVSRIPLDPVGSNVDHFIPGLAVSRTSAGAGAQLALTDYLDTDPSCSGLTCQIQVGFASSLAYGQTWSAPQILSNPMQLGWIAPTTHGAMVGVCRSPEGPRRREPHPERSGGVHRRRYHPIHTVLIDSAAWPRMASTPSAATPDSRPGQPSTAHSNIVPGFGPLAGRCPGHPSCRTCGGLADAVYWESG